MRVSQPPASKNETSYVRGVAGAHQSFFSRPLARAASEVATASSLGSESNAPLSAQFFIAAAMAVVATAIGTGLYLQLGVEFAASLLVAVASYTAMLAVHLLVRRRHTLVGLRSEIDRIETEIAGLRADRMSGTPEAHPDQAGQAGSRSAARVQTRIISGLRNRSGPNVTVAEPPIGADIDIAIPPAMPARPLTEQEWSAQCEWTFRPGDTRASLDPAVANQQNVIDGEKPTAAQTAHPSSMLPAPGPAFSGISKPMTASPAPLARTEEERDAIQQLIRRLADDLKTGGAELDGAVGRSHTIEAPEGKVSASPETDTVVQSDISRSVEALRSAASTMREASTRGAPEASMRSRDGAAPPTPAEEAPPQQRARATAPLGMPPIPPRPSGAEARASVDISANAGITPAPTATTSRPSTTQVPDLLEAIASAVETGRMNVFVEPIIGLADRKARHFEVSIRLRNSDGMPIVDTEYRMAAGGTGLLPRIDAAKMQHSAIVAGRLHEKGRRGTVHSAISGEALTDGFFVEDLTTTVATNEGIGSHLVLTFAQSDVRCFRDVHWETLAVMREFGMTFALEAVTAMDMDFDILARRGFTFVKLDASVFLEGMPTEGGLVPATDLCRYLAGLGLGLIIGHIDDERSLAKVLGFGALLGQGTLFGAPRPLDLQLQSRSAA